MDDELPPELRAILSRAGALDSPSGADRERVLGKLKGVVPLLGALVPLVTEGAAAASVAKGASSLLAVATNKVLLGGILLSLTGVATYQAVREPESRPPIPAPDLAGARAPASLTLPMAAADLSARAQSAAVAGLSSPVVEASPPVVEPSPRLARLHPSATTQGSSNLASARAEPSRPAASSDGRVIPTTREQPGLGSSSAARAEPTREPSAEVSEVDLLAEAQRALASGNPGRALALARDHQLRFARSALLTERLALEVLAYCELKRPADAEARMTQFRRMAPSSPLRPRLEASCAGFSSSRPDSQAIPELSGH